MAIVLFLLEFGVALADGDDFVVEHTWMLGFEVLVDQCGMGTVEWLGGKDTVHRAFHGALQHGQMCFLRQFDYPQHTGYDTDTVYVLNAGFLVIVALGDDNDAHVLFLGHAQEGQRGLAADTDWHHHTGEQHVAVQRQQGHVVGYRVLVQKERLIVLGDKGYDFSPCRETVKLSRVELVYFYIHLK